MNIIRTDFNCVYPSIIILLFLTIGAPGVFGTASRAATGEEKSDVAAAVTTPMSRDGRTGEAREIRIGHFPNITHAQAVLAHGSEEFEKKLGLPVKWTIFNAGPSAVEALFVDAIDATYIGPNPSINGYIKSEGSSFRIVAGSASGGAALVVRSDAGINTERDFNDKIIATPQLGNTQDVAARAWFHEKGYRLREQGGTLAILPLANPDQLLLFQKKEIHGAWTIEPWVSRLEIEGGGKVFLEEKALWPEGKYATTLLVVSCKFLKNHPETVKKLIMAHVELTQKLMSDKKAYIPAINAEIKKETGKELSPKVIESAMARVDFGWDPLVDSIKQSAQSAHKAGFIKELPDLDGLFDLSLLNAVLKEKDLPAVEYKKQ